MHANIGLMVWTKECLNKPAVQGETSHWTRLFTHFEEVTAKHVGQRADVRLQHDPSHADGDFPVAPVVAMLRTTATVLDNCSNKHQFRAQQARLLSLTAAALCCSCLQTCCVKARRYQALLGTDILCSSARLHSLNMTCVYA